MGRSDRSAFPLRMPEGARIPIHRPDSQFPVERRFTAHPNHFHALQGQETGPGQCMYGRSRQRIPPFGPAVLIFERAIEEFSHHGRFMRLFGDLFHLGEQCRPLLGKIRGLADIGIQVVQFPGRLGARTNRFPSPPAHGHLPPQLPVEKIMPRLTAPRRRGTDEFGHDGHAIHIVRDLRSGQFGHGRQNIREVPEQIADLTRLNMPGPAHHHGNAQTALVQVPFLAAKCLPVKWIDVGSVKAPRMILVPKIVHAPVVATENHEGILVQVQRFQQIEQLSHLPVDHGDHGGVTLGIQGPIPILVKGPGRIGGGNVEHAMGRSDRHIAEKRTVPMVADELHAGIPDDRVGVGFPFAATVISFEGKLLAVAHQIGGVVAVGVNLVVIAQEDIEAVPFRYAGGTSSAAPPLAESAGGISGLFQDRSDRFLALAHGSTAAIGPHRGVARMFSGEQTAPRGRAERRAGQGLGKADSFGRHAVDIRRDNVGMPHARQLVIPQLVAHDKNDVRLASIRLSRRQPGKRGPHRGRLRTAFQKRPP